MTCKFDTASFDKHFAVEAQKPKANDRDNGAPTERCHGSLQYLLTDGDSLNQFMTEKAVAKEVNAKVKTLVCRYEEDQSKAWTLELKGSELIMTIGEGTPQPPSAFMVQGMRKYFPAFKASWDEHH
jgi:hypothetical protein